MNVYYGFLSRMNYVSNDEYTGWVGYGVGVGSNVYQMSFCTKYIVMSWCCRHDMERLSALLALCIANSIITWIFLVQSKLCWTLMCSFSLSASRMFVNGSVRCIAVKTAHYDDVILTTMASQITSLTVVYSIVYSGVDQRKHQSSASLAFVRGIPRT